MELNLPKPSTTFTKRQSKAVVLEVVSMGSDGRKVRDKMRLRCVLVARVADSDLNFVFWLHINS